MGVRREALISENPYRLLTLPSEISYPQLRKRADAALKGLQVGITPPIALQSSFGDGDFEEFQSNVRLLAHDPVRRTCYRLLWPLVPTSLTAILNGGVLKREQLPNFVISQALFLNSWFDFLETFDSEELRSALKQFTAFLADKRGEKLLTELISEEDRLLETDAKSHFLAARLQVQKQVLMRSTAIAAELARGGGLDRCCSIVSVILGSTWDKDLQDASLGKVIDYGNDLSQELAQKTLEIAITTEFPPLVALDLEILISTIGNRHPATRSWADAVEHCHSTLVNHTIDMAVEISNEKKDYKQALRLLERCGQYKIQADVSARLARNLEIIKGNLTNHNYGEPQRATYQTPTRNQPRKKTMVIQTAPWGCIIWVLLASGAGISRLLEFSNHSGSSPISGPTNTVGPVSEVTASETSPSSQATLTSSPESSSLDSSVPAKPLAEDHPSAKREVVQAPPVVPIQIDTGRQKLITEHDALSAEVDAERPRIRAEQDRLKESKAAIDLDKSALDALSSSLDSQKTNIDIQRPVSTSDPDQTATFNRLVDDYNAQLQTYKANSEAFNSRVNTYNEQLENSRERLRIFNQKVDRVNELAHLINSGGGE